MAHRTAKLAALALLPGVAWSCGHVARQPLPTPAALAHYSDANLSFDYPRSWTVSHYKDVSSFSDATVYLSTQPTHDPCVRTISRTQETITCGEPITNLAPGGILVVWSIVGGPAKPLTLDLLKGSPLQVAGRPAKWNTERPGCAQIGGDEFVTVTVITARSEWYSLMACLRSPNLDLAESQLSALVATTHFKAA